MKNHFIKSKFWGSIGEFAKTYIYKNRKAQLLEDCRTLEN